MGIVAHTVTSAFRKLREEVCEFEASLELHSFATSLHLTEKTNKNEGAEMQLSDRMFAWLT